MGCIRLKGWGCAHGSSRHHCRQVNQWWMPPRGATSFHRHFCGRIPHWSEIEWNRLGRGEHIVPRQYIFSSRLTASPLFIFATQTLVARRFINFNCFLASQARSNFHGAATNLGPAVRCRCYDLCCEFVALLGFFPPKELGRAAWESGIVFMQIGVFTRTGKRPVVSQWHTASKKERKELPE